MNTLFSLKYECVLNSYNIQKLQALDMNCCVIGPHLSGKKVLIRNAFTNVVFVSKNELTKQFFLKLYQQKTFKNIGYICIHDVDINKKAKQIASIIDFYISEFTFLISSTQSPTSPLLTSRCAIFHIKPPSHTEIRNTFDNVPDEIINRYKWPHDILVALDLYAHNFPCDVYPWKLLLQRMCDSLQSLSHSDLRKYLYKCMLYPIDFDEFFKTVVDNLCEIVKDDTLKIAIVQLAAKYEHRTKLGNKDVYHAEAFMLHIKDLLQYGETN